MKRPENEDSQSDSLFTRRGDRGRLAEGIEQGWITPARRPGPLVAVKTTFPSVERIADLLDRDRCD